METKTQEIKAFKNTLDLLSKYCDKEIHAKMYFCILRACALQKH